MMILSKHHLGMPVCLLPALAAVLAAMAMRLQLLLLCVQTGQWFVADFRTWNTNNALSWKHCRSLKLPSPTSLLWANLGVTIVNQYTVEGSALLVGHKNFPSSIKVDLA
jgi:hypothetical protein